MRFRLLLLVVTLGFLSFGKACSYTADPGENCEGSPLAEVSCPQGYSCDDMENWTCVPNVEEYPDYGNTPVSEPDAGTAVMGADGGPPDDADCDAGVGNDD